MPTITVKTPQEVMWWIETHDHHSANAEDPKFLVLKGNTHVLRIPTEIGKKCFIKPAGPYDTRMYRWDHEAEAKAYYASIANKKKEHKKLVRKKQTKFVNVKNSVPEIKQDEYLEGIRNRD